MVKRDFEQLTITAQHEKVDKGPVVCLGIEFENDEKRREYFKEELRKKLPKLKEIDGFPIGEDEDIIELSDPPYYTTCPNPWINDFIKEWDREKVEQYGRDPNEKYHREPFASDVNKEKKNPFYTAHGYHTKVPYRVVMRYLLHFTNPGDVILDAFSGTGMTGVAASLCNSDKVLEEMGFILKENNELETEDGSNYKKGTRHSIMNDLSPIANFIAYNYTYPISSSEFKKQADQVLEEVEEECSWMYRTLHTINGITQEDNNGNPIYGKVNYTVYSDVFLCPSCTEEIVFTEVALDAETGRVKELFHCPSCMIETKKRGLERVWETKYDPMLKKTFNFAKQVPYLINYNIGKERYVKQLDHYDYEILSEIEKLDIPYWFPIIELPEGYNTTQPKRSHGINYIHHFYSKRALYTLSKTYDVLNRLEEKYVPYLTYTFEQAILGMAKISRYVPTHYSQVNQYLSGTLYIGSQVVDVSLPYIIDNKIVRLTKLLDEYWSYFNKTNLITNQSAQNLKIVPNNSIDYVFTDPPFGANLMYSELNILWEAWLKVRTNNKKESIVNPTQNKSITDYENLMINAFMEYFRVLKPGRWITVEFSNSQASVWNAIQNSILKAGFIIADVAALDKKQGSFKAVTTTTAVKQDLVISAYKPKEENIERMKKEQNTIESAWTFTFQHLEQLTVFMGVKGEAEIITERTPRILFDRMVAYHVQNGFSVPISSGDFQAEVAQRFPMRDGMVFLENQVAEYDKKRILVKDFTQMNLFVSDENSAIEWIRQQLMNKPQSRQDLHPNFMIEIQHIAKHELLPELDNLLNESFLHYDGDGVVPNQIVTYLRRNFKNFRGLEPDDPEVIKKATNRWYVPNPNKQADLEKLRERSLLREFDGYLVELDQHKRKLNQFRTEAIRAGFKKAFSDKDYQKIITVGERLPNRVIPEDDKLLMYFDNASIRLGL